MTNAFFFEGRFLKGEAVELAGEEFHHLAHVMRMKSGEHVILVNGKNQRANACIQKIEKASAQLTILSIQEGRAKPQITLAQALFRLSRLEWLIEKAVELDVTDIWLFASKRSEKRALSSSQFRRLEQIAISAMKQCKRLDLPKIHFASALEEIPMTGTLLFGDLRPAASPISRIDPPLTICIGPEGGFTDEEIRYLEEKGGRGVSLHKNVLRSETAAVVALSLVNH